MAFKSNIDELLQRKMDRAEFLRLAVVMLAGVVGIARFMSLMSGSQASSPDTFGGGAYGGKAEAQRAQAETMKNLAQ